MKRLDIEPEVNRLLKSLKLVAFDFDGVFTDNSVYVSQEGVEAVRCSRSDGLGLQLLADTGVASIIVSSETNSVVKHRAKKLKIDCAYGVECKNSFIKSYMQKNDLHPNQVAFVGNDINDLSAFEVVGLAVAVNDAFDVVKEKARITLLTNGGYGAVREFCELVARAKVNE